MEDFVYDNNPEAGTKEFLKAIWKKYTKFSNNEKQLLEPIK